MNKKLLAAAIAGTLAAPVAIADVAVSGSIRVGVQGASDGTDTTWQIKNSGSRLRFKASEDLGNGQAAYVTYEFCVDAGAGSIGGGSRNRLTEVGIKGGWGSVSLGSQWSTQWSMVGTHIDKSNAFGGQGYQGQYRMNNSVRYKTSMGALSVGIDGQMRSGGDDVDSATVGFGGSMGALKYGMAWRDNGDSDYTGIGFGTKMGDLKISGGWSDVDGGSSGSNINIGGIAGMWFSYG
ncbi:MAG: porin, partial [Gammaproteobacteria bacterium]|nr:porin [Gammaproteobacteria bacterium]